MFRISNFHRNASVPHFCDEIIHDFLHFATLISMAVQQATVLVAFWHPDASPTQYECHRQWITYISWWYVHHDQCSTQSKTNESLNMLVWYCFAYTDAGRKHEYLSDNGTNPNLKRQFLCLHGHWRHVSLCSNQLEGFSESPSTCQRRKFSPLLPNHAAWTYPWTSHTPNDPWLW